MPGRSRRNFQGRLFSETRPQSTAPAASGRQLQPEGGPAATRERGAAWERGPGPAPERHPGAAWERGPGAAWERGPGAAWERGPGAAWERGPGAAWERGPGPAPERRPGAAWERGPGPAHERGPGAAWERGPGPAHERGPGAAWERGPGAAWERGPGHARARGPGRARARGPGRARARGPAAARSRGRAAVRGRSPGAAWERGLPAAREQQKGAEGGVPSPGEAELSAKLQTLSVTPRTGGLFEDHVVNTRQNMEHVKTSKIGSEGTKVKLMANHFRVTSRPQWNAYVYNVDFNPEVEDTALRTDLLLQNKSELGNYFLLDGNSLILPRKVENVDKMFGRNEDDKVIQITLRFSKELRPSHPECIRYFNILFRRVLKLMNLKQIGRNYYNNKKAMEFHEHKMEIWPGYITSILQYENSLTLCADVSHKLIRMETAYDIIVRIYENTQYGDWKKRVEEELIGSIIITKYNNRTYRIDNINWDQYPEDTFKRADGSVVTFVDYYMERYRECITDLNQPLLSSQGKWKKGQQDIPREPILLVPELCYLTGLTDPMRKNSRIMRDLALHTRLGPQRRQNELKEFIKAVQQDQTVQDELQLWDLKFDSNFLTFSGRVMDEVKVHQPRGWFEAIKNQAEWMRGTKTRMLSVETVNQWTLMYSTRCSEAADKLLDILSKIAPDMGMTISKPDKEIITDEFETYISRLKKLDLNQKQMVVCVLPNDKKDRYDDIKKYLCIDCPIPSQCVVAKTLEKPQTLLTIVTKIVQQINCKLGGALWTVEISLQRTMFIGIDCFHDIAHQHKSIAGFVASTNQELTRWYSECVIQEAGQELVSGLDDCLKGAIAVWLENIPSVPMNIIVYRDGVGDGQLQALLDHEIPQLVNCLETNFPVRINLTFIVVKKRINTRFFLEQQGGLRNPSPGTVIDVELTKHEWYDFFIVSQSVTDGTVTPTHYNVIYDTVGLKPDEVQRLTYQLCHMYYNLPGIIRVPAPCHYAHKLAYLVGQSIHEKPHISLSKFLYYI